MGRTVSNDPTQRFRFSVQVGSSEFGAKNVSGLEEEIEVTTYREGGTKKTLKLPGIESTGTATIEKGAFADVTMYNMIKDALTKQDFRKTITITEKNRMGKAIRQHILYEAWASKFTRPEYDAESSEVATESIEIQYEDIVTKKV